MAFPFDGYWLVICCHDDYDQAVEEFEASGLGIVAHVTSIAGDLLRHEQVN